MVPQIFTRAPWEKLRFALGRWSIAVQTGLFEPELESAGEKLLTWLLREYEGRSRRVWDKISIFTYVLSRKRVQTPFVSAQPPTGKRGGKGSKAPRMATAIKQIESRARRARPLIDTASTRSTLIRGRPHNVFRVEPRAVTVGSTSPILASHQKNRVHQFKFGREEQLRLKRNVPPSKGKRKTRNELYYFLFAALKKGAGKARLIPARKMPTEPPAVIVSGLKRSVVMKMAQWWKDAIRKA